MLLTLNADVWGHIFRCGGLTAVDAQSLVATSHALRDTLLSDHKIWSGLFSREWGPLLSDLVIPIPYPPSWFSLVIQCQAIFNWLENRVCAEYSNLLTHDLVKTFSRLPLYIPIAVRLLLKHESILFDGIAESGAPEAKTEINLSAVYQLANLVNAAMFRHALDYFKAQFRNPSVDENIELACVKLSFFDSDCYRYIHMRNKKLAEIHSRFKSVVTDSILDEKRPHARIEKCLAHRKPILHLDSIAAYKDLILELSIVVSSCFDCDHLVPSEVSGTGMSGTDDYSVLRFYAGVSAGCSLMMLMIVQKTLREYFGQFELYIAGERNSFRSSLAKYCLVFYGFGCLFALYVIDPRRGYVMNFDNSEEVRSFFRARRIRPEDAAQFIEPVTILKLVQFHMRKNSLQIQTYQFTGEQFKGRGHVRRIDEAQYRLTAAVLSFTIDAAQSLPKGNVDNLWLQLWRGNNSIHLMAVASYLPTPDFQVIKARFRREQSILVPLRDKGDLMEVLREYWPCDQHGLFVQHKRYPSNRGIILGYKGQEKSHFVMAVPEGLAIWDVDSAGPLSGDIRTELQKWLREMRLDSERLRGFDRVRVSDAEVRFLKASHAEPECIDEAFGLRAFMKYKFRVLSARPRP